MSTKSLGLQSTNEYRYTDAGSVYSYPPVGGIGVRKPKLYWHLKFSML